MASYYSRLEEAIKKNEERLRRLNEDLKDLRAVRDDIPSSEYHRQSSQTLYQMDKEQRQLEYNRNMLYNYRSAQRNHERIQELQSLLESESDPEIRVEISYEIDLRQASLSRNLGSLTDELAQEIRDSFDVSEEKEATDDKTTSITPQSDDIKTTEIDAREKGLKADYQEAETEYVAAEEAFRASGLEIIRIFDEERTRREHEGPFATEEELDAFTAEYMRQKVAEAEKFNAAKENMKKAKRRMNTIERQTEEYAHAKEKAASYNIPVEDYERIRKTVTSKNVLAAVYDKKGLGEVSRRSKEGKAQAEEVTEEVIAGVIKQLQDNGVDLNQISPTRDSIIDSINIIYGTDIAVKAGGSRKTTLPESEVRQVQKTKVKVKKITGSRGNQPEKKPGKAPEDVPMTTATSETPQSSQTEKTSSTENDDEMTSSIPPQGRTINYNNPNIFDKDGFYHLPKDQIIQDNANSNAGTTQPTTPQSKTPDTASSEKTQSNPTGNNPSDDQQKGNTPTGTSSGDSSKGNQPKDTVPVGNQPKDIVPVGNQPKDIVPVGNQPKDIVPVAETPPKQTPVRGLYIILDELTYGLELRKKDGKRYRASNIRVAKEFKEELSSGNYLYNIVHLVPAIIKLPFKLLRKASGLIMSRPKAKKNIKILKERIAKLSEEELMIIFNEYRGNQVMQEQYPTIMNTLLDERVQEFALKKVTEINAELEARYKTSFVAIKKIEAIDKLLADPKTSEADKKKLNAERARILKGQAENIAAIRNGYTTANQWLSGGAHGFSEDMKAAATKLSIVGKGLVKEQDLDGDLLHRQAQLQEAEKIAIRDGNDEMALRAFIESEKLLSSNTEISASLVGRRSTGKKYYSPLVEQLDYRDDPFIRDLFTTIAVVTSTITTVQSIKSAHDQAAIIAENNRRMAQNNQTMQQVNQIGTDIAGKRGDMMEGMQAQGMSDTLSGANEIERAILDKTDWGLGTNAYRTADSAGHTYFTNFYDGTKNAYENIAQQYSAGQISQAQAMDLMAQVTSNTHTTFEQINSACLNILKPYAQTHPQFDLSGVQGAMEYLQANPSAVDAMNQAMIDVTNAGDVLASMQLEQLIPLTTLPDSIRTVIINGASTVVMASAINNTMAAKKHKYGNSVTDMVGEYVESQNQSTNSSNRTTK